MGTNTAETEVSTKRGVAQVGTSTAEAEMGTKAAETQGVGNNMGEEQCQLWVTATTLCSDMNKVLQNTKFFYRSKCKA